MLKALQQFGATLDNYLHLLLPPVLRVLDVEDMPITVRKAALETLDRLTDDLDLTEYSSRIIHPLVRMIENYPELRDATCDTLCSIVLQLGMLPNDVIIVISSYLGQQYKVFAYTVKKALSKAKYRHSKYESLITHINNVC